MQMNSIAAIALLLTALAGCAGEVESGQEIDVVGTDATDDSDLLRGDDSLFPLSTYFGVCARNLPTLRSQLDSGMPARHYASVAFITVGSGELILNIGKFQLDPDIDWSDVSPRTPSRRVRGGVQGSSRHLLVTEFEPTGRNMVSIQYDDGDDRLHEAAVDLANNIVGCRLVSPDR